ncbi:unnamed protein product [Vitrella brassicaformis CCMP3155]|uniref:SMP-30/Gluconolactonase/LRE-like region domain-containing protein n=1 Tax=Vitrella brassicaformis (strain CCMP3155) TaxID=1169540 RepID=A0A0G4EJ26_VITBC|nr:unnamed protein product [Vitrella brassicaformis CCMP3155]|eukprot:CEL97016.1 unnamed protein product [Vitrella brassicaformis CCMP3155]
MTLAFLSLTAAAVEDAPFLQPVNDQQQPSEQQASLPFLVENLVDYLTALRESERLTREEETICYDGSSDGSELPSVLCGKVNSYLAASPWPTSHRTPYSQGSTPLRSLEEADADELQHDFLNEGFLVLNPINLFYTEDLKYLWGSSWTTVFKIDRTGPEMRLAGFVEKPVEDIFGDVFHGAYSLLSHEGVFFTATGLRIEAYLDDTTKLPLGDHIKRHPKPYVFAEGSESKKEVIRALQMTYDGRLAFATNLGKVGVTESSIFDPSRMFGGRNTLAYLQLGEGEDDTEVSNNIQVDEDGGIYVVSNKKLHKVVWDPKSMELTLAWETPYKTTAGNQLSRLGEGSGSTPSIMGDKNVGRYVVITDGQKLMHVVVFDAETGKICDQYPVTFGDPWAESSVSEQSVLVNGWRFAVVNNEVTRQRWATIRNLDRYNFLAESEGEAVNNTGMVVEAEGRVVREIFRTSGLRERRPLLLGKPATVIDEPDNVLFGILRNQWPVLVGDAPYGVEQFEFNKFTNRIRSVWANPDVSIPNGIPCMSASSGLMYGVGKRRLLTNRPAAPLQGVWTLEALDWKTGEHVISHPIGSGPFTNSAYAATEIGPDEIITGTIAGIVRVRRRPWWGFLKPPPLASFLEAEEAAGGNDTISL